MQKTQRQFTDIAPYSTDFMPTEQEQDILSTINGMEVALALFAPQ